MRTKLSICLKKARYPTARDALAEAKRTGLVRRPYRCDRCRLFHLTSRTKGKRTPRPATDGIDADARQTQELARETLRPSPFGIEADMIEREGENMQDMLGYQGKKVVITGAASGMGEAATALLIDLGAEVYALDIAPVKLPVHKVIAVNLAKQDSIDAALPQIPDKIDFLFNCAGVPHPPFSALDTVLINFVGMRYLTEALLPRIVDGGGIASIASTAGMGWKANLDKVRAFLAVDGFAAAEAWLGQNDAGEPYSFSKQSMIVYTMEQAGPLAKRNIRINCIAPSPTETEFMKKLTVDVDRSAVELFCPSNGQWATGADMGNALVMLNSKLAGFVSGLCVPVDFGYTAEVLMGQRDNLGNIS